LDGSYSFEELSGGDRLSTDHPAKALAFQQFRRRVRGGALWPVLF
jgi:hypothetical protein